MAIAHQPAMTTEAVPTRPPAPAGFARSGHELVLVDEPVRAWTLAKIVGLVAITAISAAVAVAIVAGGALFAILTIS